MPPATPDAPPPVAPDAPTPPDPAARRYKLLAGAALAVVLAVGLYYLNRYWIAPAASAQTKGDSNHPLAPDFSLTDITGQPLKLSDFHGKVVVLNFWATWCGPCRIEIPDFIELQNRYAAQGYTTIGISMDTSPEPVVEFYKELKMNYPVAVGNDRLGDMYGGMGGLPTTFVIGRDGRIYAKHVGATDPRVFEQEIKELLALSPTAEATGFHQVGVIYSDDKVKLGNPDEYNSEVPGVDVSKLTAEQKEAFKKKLETLMCPCGCKMSIMRCRKEDYRCAYSRKIAQDQLEALLKEKPPEGTKASSAAAK
jgi:peroxiredoxin